MADNKDLVAKATSGLAAAGAAFGARKAASLAWKKVRGTEPPDGPEDQSVSLVEALVWAMLVGAIVNTARMLAARAMNRGQPAEADAGE